jgi:hypothetical protein
LRERDPGADQRVLRLEELDLRDGALVLGVSRTALIDRLKKYGLG